MSEKTWTVDQEVRFHRLQGWPDEPIPPAPGAVMCVVKGTTTDGKRFVCETWVTEALLADRGEARVAEMLRRDAHPPEDFYT